MSIQTTTKNIRCNLKTPSTDGCEGEIIDTRQRYERYDLKDLKLNMILPALYVITILTLVILGFIPNEKLLFSKTPRGLYPTKNFKIFAIASFVIYSISLIPLMILSSSIIGIFFAMCVIVPLIVAIYYYGKIMAIYDRNKTVDNISDDDWAKYSQYKKYYNIFNSISAATAVIGMVFGVYRFVNLNNAKYNEANEQVIQHERYSSQKTLVVPGGYKMTE